MNILMSEPDTGGETNTRAVEEVNKSQTDKSKTNKQSKK